MTLAALLKKRQLHIADEAMCKKEPTEYLRLLGDVTLAIEAWHHEHRSQISREMSFLLHQRNYSEALKIVDRSALVAC